jgi:spore maturation protein CgeB
MRILYQIPSLNTIYAGRTIYFGYKHAFEDLGHRFKPLTSDDDPEQILNEFEPDILFTSLNFYNLKYLSAKNIEKYRKRGTKIFVNIPFWKSPMSKLRINETPSISEKKDYVRLMKSGNYGDVYFNNCEQGDYRMEGFEKTTGYYPYTVLLAADKTIPSPNFSEKFACDVSFIGTYLPEKRKFINEFVFPLREKYDLKLYGRDWTILDRMLNFAHRAGQYYNIPYLRSFKKYAPTLEEERQIHRSSTIALNIHEDYQKRSPGDLNERTFKIPISGGFEISDNVPSLSKYFKDGEELIIAKNRSDWFEKIDYYIKNPNKRIPIIGAGKKKVMRNHTYHNRVQQLLLIYKNL